MAELTFREPFIRPGIAQEMKRDPRNGVFLGEDTPSKGRPLVLTKQFGPLMRTRSDLRAGDPWRRHGRGDGLGPGSRSPRSCSRLHRRVCFELSPNELPKSRRYMTNGR